ncbi:MAG: F0F1 ATP synthase subunit B [Candidatus Omnitrophica bacterium]|nr:F0F1 ATP synthase subunit B [Candidatus Omnitrophota bacterium]
MDNRQILSEIIVQVLGFLAVFFLLKKLAWGKLMGAIDARRGKIRDEFQAIEKQKADLETLAKDYRRRLQHIDEEARAKIQEASEAGLTLAQDIQDKARGDAEKLLERAKAEIQQDIQKARLEMRNELVDLSTLITEKVLREKLDAREHERLVNQFIKDLENVR